MLLLNILFLITAIDAKGNQILIPILLLSMSNTWIISGIHFLTYLLNKISRSFEFNDICKKEFDK